MESGYAIRRLRKHLKDQRSAHMEKMLNGLKPEEYWKAIGRVNAFDEVEGKLNELLKSEDEPTTGDT